MRVSASGLPYCFQGFEGRNLAMAELLSLKHVFFVADSGFGTSSGRPLQRVCFARRVLVGLLLRFFFNPRS